MNPKTGKVEWVDVDTTAKPVKRRSRPENDDEVRERLRVHAPGQWYPGELERTSSKILDDFLSLSDLPARGFVDEIG